MVITRNAVLKRCVDKVQSVVSGKPGGTYSYHRGLNIKRLSINYKWYGLCTWRWYKKGWCEVFANCDDWIGCANVRASTPAWKLTCFFSKTSRLALGHTKPPVQCVPGTKRGVKQTTKTLSSADIRNEWSCTSPPPPHPHPIWFHSVDRDNFTFYTSVLWLP